MRARMTAVATVTASLIGVGCGGTDEPVPKVVGERLDVATTMVEDAGYDVEPVGGGAFGILDESNWTVCRTIPNVGTVAGGGKVRLVVDRSCPDAPKEQRASKPATSGSEQPVAAEIPPVAQRLLTRLENRNYDVSETGVGSGEPAPLITYGVVFRGKGEAAIYVYDTADDARLAREPFRAVEDENPDQIKVKRVGTRLYVGTIEEPATFPKKRLDKLISVAEDRPLRKAKPRRSQATASSSASTIVVPSVVGMGHQAAQNRMQAAGLYLLDEEDATGQGRMLLYDRNWVVVAQEPAAGSSVSPETTVLLSSKKIGE